MNIQMSSTVVSIPNPENSGVEIIRLYLRS